MGTSLFGGGDCEDKLCVLLSGNCISVSLWQHLI